MSPSDLALFSGLPRESRDALARAATICRVEAGDVLVREGEPARTLYCVASGRFEVVKRIPGGSAEHRIHELGVGEPIGEVGFFDGKARSATVRALEGSVVFAVPYDVVSGIPVLVRRLGERAAERLRVASEDELEGAQRRATMGTLVVKVITLLSGYAMLVAALPGIDLGATSTTYVSLPVIAAFGWASIRFIRSSGYPLSRFGLGFRELPMSMVEAAVLTPLFCAFLVGLKAAALAIVPRFQGLPLIERPDWQARLAEPGVAKLLGIYFVASAVQELIVRSALQTSLEEFLVGPGARRTTLFVCALMFAVNHLHMSFAFAALAFVPGLFWGFLFARRRHLAGPALSHFFVGAFVFFVLGVSLP